MRLLGGGRKAGLCFAEGNSALTYCMKPQCNPKEVCYAVPGGDNLPNRELQCNVMPSVTSVSSGCLQTTNITLWETELWQPDLQELQAQLFQTSSALHTSAEFPYRLLSPHQGAWLSLRLSDYCWHRPGRFELCQLSGLIHLLLSMSQSMLKVSIFRLTYGFWARKLSVAITVVPMVNSQV